MPRKFRDFLNLDDLQRGARRRLPQPIYDYLESGADDQFSYRRNRGAFSKWSLLPEVCTDVSQLDLSTTVLGQRLDWPVLLAPTGMSKMFHPQGELAVARAAERCNTLYSAASFSAFTLEQIAEVRGEGANLLQFYPMADQGLNEELIDRAKAAGYRALCLTLDTVVMGNREPVARAGLTIPPQLSLASVLAFLRKPGWMLDRMRGGSWELANFTHSPRLAACSDTERQRRMGSLANTFRWEALRTLIARWNGPFAVKGILRSDDALRALDAGASTIILSNHGGRQLDCTPAPIDCLPAMRAALGPSAELIIDGGIRRGTQVIQALALGANACMIGRPYLYGLASAGQAGVEHALTLLRGELERDLKLLGCPRVADLSPHHLQHNPIDPMLSPF